jgi:hypothetical protein
MSSIQKGTSCFIYYQGLDRGNMKALKLWKKAVVAYGVVFKWVN